MKPFAVGVAAIALTAAASSALAHHSFAMFDFSKTVTLSGVVKEFDWSSPHCWIDIVVTDATGKAQEWAIETGAPPMLMRTGWTFKTLQPGDKVTLAIHPLRTGKPSGALVSATLADGRVLGPGGAPKPLPLKAVPKG